MTSKKSHEPKTILFDIETAPSRGFTWQKWETNVIYFDQHWFILSFAYQVLGEKIVQVKRLCDYPGYEKDKTNDKSLVKDLWNLFDEAEILVGHNCDAFDIKKSNARFLFHNLGPTSPFKSIDTLKGLRRQFKLDSNKLDDAASYLGLGNKLSHHGKDMWKGCMEGDKKSWAEMAAYNKHDVVLLHGLYLRIRPFMTSHPNFNNWTREEACPVCQSHKIQHRGHNVTKTGQSQRLFCRDCGHWFSGPYTPQKKAS